MKAITLLGSTGSIGTQTLDLVAQYPEQFQVVGLATRRNINRLAEQIKQFRPQIVGLADPDLEADLRALLADTLADTDPMPPIVVGPEGLCEVAAYGNAELVVTGIVGCAGLLPTLAAIKAGKNIALANKETLVAGGPVVLPLVQEHGTKLIPVDSEHSAIFQCLQGIPDGSLRRVILTASGGAFRDWPTEKLAEVTLSDALKHPNWVMGQKITIDSATLMNKGLEVIEAHWLFGTDYDHIDIVIHPQSIIHSLIELEDTSVLAQLGWPDMHLPLLYGLTWPERFVTTWDPLDLVKLASLTFKAPDHLKYPCMNLAYAAGRAGGTMPAVLNAANEAVVGIFLQERIHFLQIPQILEAVCARHDVISVPTLDDILYVDSWARSEVLRVAEPEKETVLV